MEYTTTIIANEDPIIDISEEINKLLSNYGDTHLYVIHALYVQDTNPYDEYDKRGSLTITIGYHYSDDRPHNKDLSLSVLRIFEFKGDRRKQFITTNKDLDMINAEILGPNRLQVRIRYTAESPNSIY